MVDSSKTREQTSAFFGSLSRTFLSRDGLPIVYERLIVKMSIRQTVYEKEGAAIMSSPTYTGVG